MFVRSNLSLMCICIFTFTYLYTPLDHFLIHTAYRKQYLLLKHGRITIECNKPEEVHKTLGKYIRYQRKKLREK